MKSKFVGVSVLVIAMFLAGGCGSVVREAAVAAQKDQYRKAMEEGRMSPVDYQRAATDLDRDRNTKH